MTQAITTYQVCTVGRANTRHFVARIDLGNGKIFDCPQCRFSYGKVSWRSELLSKEDAVKQTTCKACVRK